MRLTRILLALAIIAATLGPPAANLCATPAQAQSRELAMGSSCGATSQCCPQGKCPCIKSPLGQTDDTAVAAPTPIADGCALALAPVAGLLIHPDVALAGRVVPSLSPAATSYHASCLSNRAPPLS